MALGAGPRQSWLFNSTIGGIEGADVVLLVGTNPRLEATVLNARLRKRWLAGALKVGVIGEQVDLTFPYEYLGAGPKSLADLAKSKGSFWQDYKFTNPTSKKIEPKSMYCEKVDELVACAGIYK